MALRAFLLHRLKRHHRFGHEPAALAHPPRLQVERKTETLRRGWATVPLWVFCTKRGTPHCFRHTFASLLLQRGESPAYDVQRQLGHASIQLTVDTYGRWLPMGNKAAVDRLDGRKW